MSRIGKAYETRFRALLLRLRARRSDTGVKVLLQRASALAWAENVPQTAKLALVYERLRSQVRAFERRTGRSVDSERKHFEPFLCDAGLGGLARWLRAAGYDARWLQDIDDAELLRHAEELDATLLTTDSLMMERGILRDGFIRAFWLPPAGGSIGQLAAVLREFNLPVREPRCMHCGGELRPADKESMRDRIPPKTWLWINDYYLCGRCGKLFWHGTHWQRIQTALSALAPATSAGSPS